MKFTTLAEIRAYEFSADKSEHEAYDAIDEFAADETNSLKDRANALRIYEREMMGLAAPLIYAELSDEDVIGDWQITRFG